MEVVVEVVEPGRRAPSIKRFRQTEVVIGRAWDADLVITDIEVDPYHAKLVFDEEGNFEVSDLDSTNGTRLKGKRCKGIFRSKFGDALTIGQTTFRVHRKLDTVAPAKIHSPTERVLHYLGQPLTAILVAVAAIVLLQYSQFVSSGVPFEWNNQLQGLISVASGLLLWAFLWGGITKLLKHQFKVWAHLGLAAALLIASLVLDEVESFLSFNLLSPSISGFLQAASMALMIFVWVILGLIISANTRQRTRFAVACALAGLFLLTSFLLPRFQQQNWVGLVPLETQSMTPGLKLAPTKSSTDFFQGIEENIREVDQRRLEILEEKEKDDS